MSNGLSLDQIEDRMAIVRDNIRQLIEQSAADSGAGTRRAMPTVSRSSRRSWNR